MNTNYNGPIEEVEIVEKVVLTEQQAAAIKFYRSQHFANGEILGVHFNGNAEDINDISIATDKLVAALYEGYEIEPEQPKFQPGDKVIHTDGRIADTIFTLKNKMPVKETAWEFENGGWDYEKVCRHATPEEIFWLDTLGRNEVGDFREGDIYVNSFGRASAIDKAGISLESAKKAYDQNAFQGIYPAESFRPFKKEQPDE